MKHRNSERGMAAFWFIFVMGIAVPAMVVFTMNYTSIVTKVKRITQTVTSKQSIYVVKNMILKDAADVDADSRFELLKEEAGNTIPTAVVGKSTDEWGTEFFYCTWDLGALNGSDATYADNNVAPPVANLAGRIISAGKDKTVETNCTSHTVAQGDDMMVEIYESDALSSTSGISGWADDGSDVRLVNSSDSVGIGTATPAEKLEVVGGIKVGTSAGTNAGTIRYDGTNFQGYNGTSWRSMWGPKLVTSGEFTATNGTSTVFDFTAAEDALIVYNARPKTSTTVFVRQAGAVTDGANALISNAVETNIQYHRTTGWRFRATNESGADVIVLYEIYQLN